MLRMGLNTRFPTEFIIIRGQMDSYYWILHKREIVPGKPEFFYQLPNVLL